MGKDNPRNSLEALTYQLEDDVRVLRCVSLMDDIKEFKQGLKRMYQHIDGVLELRKKEKV